MVAYCSMLAVPAAFLAGLLRSRLARGGLADLFRELGGMRGSALQAALGRALGDPSLLLAHRRPDGPGHVDADGRPGAGPAGRGRSVDGADPARRRADRRPRSTTRRSTRTRSSWTPSAPRRRSRWRTSASSRSPRPGSPRCRRPASGSSTAGDNERRRLERDLHDGAQQRLVAVMLQLRLLRSDIRRNPDQAELLASAGRATSSPTRSRSSGSSRAASTRRRSTTGWRPRSNRSRRAPRWRRR